MTPVGVSVLIPFNRQEAYIAEAVRSLQNQSFAGFQAVLVDNLAVDDSLRVAKEAAGDDSRFLFEREEKPGIDRALNRGLSRAVGEWVTFLDADDYYFPERLEKAMAVAEAQEADMVVCRGLKVDEGGKPFGESERLIYDPETYPMVLLQSNISWSLSFLTVRGNKLRSLGPLPHAYNSILDYYLLLQACQHGWKIVFIDEPLIGKRHHGGNYSADELRLMAQEIPLTVDFLQNFPPARQFFSDSTLRRIMTQKYLRGVQYARRQKRFAEIIGFAEPFVADGWIMRPFFDYYRAMALLRVEGESAFLVDAGQIDGLHPLDFFLRGLALFFRKRYALSEKAFADAEKIMRSNFQEASLSRAMAAIMIDPPRGKKLLKAVLNQRPDYQDAWVAWQQLSAHEPLLRPTLFLGETSLRSLLQYEGQQGKTSK